jgi:hypothetical protein
MLKVKNCYFDFEYLYVPSANPPVTNLILIISNYSYNADDLYVSSTLMISNSSSTAHVGYPKFTLKSTHLLFTILMFIRGYNYFSNAHNIHRSVNAYTV